MTSPPPPQQYTYAPLPSKSHIRLIKPLVTDPPNPETISFQLLPYDLFSPSSLPKFTALSYTWGYPGFYKGPRPTSPPFDHWDTPTHRVNITTIDSHGTTSHTRPFLVRTNLFDALTVLFHVNEIQREEYIWIDAICVDQGNDAEKAVQVCMMGDIYERAEQVISWLGKLDRVTDVLALRLIWKVKSSDQWSSTGGATLLSSEEEAEAQRKQYDWLTAADLREPESYEKLGIEFVPMEQWMGWLRLVSRPYFRRVWMVQEILKAKKLDVLIGNAVVPWEDFAKAASFAASIRGWGVDEIVQRGLRMLFGSGDDEVKEATYSDDSNGENSGQGDAGRDESDGDDSDEWNYAYFWMLDVASSNRVFGLQSHAELVLSRNRFRSTSNQACLELDVLLDKHRMAESGDPRDKVYALVGLVGRNSDTMTASTGALVIDYTVSVEIVYTRTARHLCRSFRDLRILHHREPNSKRQIHSLPSWVPDFSAKHGGGALHVGAGGGGDWMASGNGTAWVFDEKQPLEDPELPVKGRLLGIIKDVCPDPSTQKGESWKGWKHIMELALSLRTSSDAESQSRGPLESLPLPSPMEHLARTLTRDTLSGMSPAPEDELAIQCLNYMIDQYFESLGYGDPTAEDTEQARDLNARYQLLLETPTNSRPSLNLDGLLATLTRREHQSSPYSWDQFKTQLEGHIKYKTRTNLVYAPRNRPGGKPDRRLPVTKEKLVQTEITELRGHNFRARLDRSLANRAVFITTGGETLGLGPDDATPMDEVWVLDGATTPVVLRRTTRPGRYYEFVGEAYMHGIMHGEAVGGPVPPDDCDIILV